LLGLVGIFRVINLGGEASLSRFIMAFYFLAIAFIIISVETGYGKTQQWFLFLNFGWGKAIMYGYLTCLILGTPSTTYMDWIVALLFLVAALANVYIYNKFRAEEMEETR
jgi:hypothetical protein